MVKVLAFLKMATNTKVN